ncbi:biotin/lipoyl-containing protein [Desulfuribacillus alkaliarsenatis]|uniref:Lipoyl-binding domain-containing protein n=1 Tax=Desulfuribacillus alkaliarsenatis TaxID=766136 RepID=A0A1E5FZU7_9FIRM|nr:biotin/lipoyl-containing protein [Desulfuribacillus alkaliarsenatis]OEF96101.1 hypothetical protein BHF68_10225 [Desulfuribacillus alkaliarsenatis]
MKKFRVTVEGKTYEVEVEEILHNHKEDTLSNAGIANAAVNVPVKATVPNISSVQNQEKTSAPESTSAPASGSTSTGVEVKAPVTGTILRVEVKVGSQIKAGQTVVVLEAMKMETEVQAATAGTVSNVFVSTGANVNSGQTLLTIDSEDV